MANAFEQVLGDIIARKWRILIFVLLATVFAVAVSYLLPNRYRAEATILPEAGSGKSSMLGGFADIAAMAGVSTNEMKLSKLFPTILMSETVLREAIFHRYTVEGSADAQNLIEFLRIDQGSTEKDFDAAVKEMRSRLEATLDYRTDVVTVTLEMEQSQLAADVANQLLKEMDRFLRETRRTKVSEQKKWLDERLSQVRTSLERAEETLKEFRVKNRQTADSPQLLLEQERLVRQVQINSTIFIELTKQYEIARVEEIKNTPLVNLLDPARAPTTRYKPKRTTIAVSAVLVSLLSAVFSVGVWAQFSGQIRRFGGLFAGPKQTRDA
jgi:uncharacterized protein involved in exopolysaccharide biosynthesis